MASAWKQALLRSSSFIFLGRASTTAGGAELFHFCLSFVDVLSPEGDLHVSPHTSWLAVRCTRVASC